MINVITNYCYHSTDFGSNARFEEDTFLKRAQLIKKYVGKDRELQLSVLYALQRAVTELQHPPGKHQNVILECCLCLFAAVFRCGCLNKQWKLISF